jgi:TrmH family RNA methyltransferase
MPGAENELSKWSKTAILGVFLTLLTSTQNPVIKEIRRAIAQGGLTRDGFCVTEGPRLLEEAVRSGCEIGFVLSAGGAVTPPGVHVIGIAESLLRDISATETPQGILALVRPPTWTVEQVTAGHSLVVVLDGIQEPGNAGAILRAAEAFSATGAVFLKGTVNPYNPKCVRASAGSIFRLPLVHGVEDLNSLGPLALYAAVPDGGTVLNEANLRSPCGIIIGSEGRGVRPEISGRATALRIPTAGVESLNAAVAAGILLYEARRQREGA